MNHCISPALTTILFICTKPVLAGILDTIDWRKADLNFPWLPFENESRCYGKLGCINITRSWYHVILRPINVFPLPQEVIDTKFILYSRSNPTEGQILNTEDAKSIDESHFLPTRKTKFIIHGFIDTPLSKWIGDLRDELLKNDDVNVIVVDWAGGSLPLYTQAVANTRLVGLEIANLIKYLIDNFKMDPNDIHLIGHSLGAHTAGYVGSLIPNLGRITGLDPAEPFFQGMPNHVRLDPSDAQLVDVIHTDGKGIIYLGYGMSQPCGHLDFYPNDGKEQPGCDIAQQTPLIPLTLIRDGLEEASRVLLACNHVRAIKLFIDSINNPCQYIAHKCNDYEAFKSGKCFDCKIDGSCMVMGFHADNKALSEEQKLQQLEESSNKYFLITGRDYPYCYRLYRVTLELARPNIAEGWVQGYVKLVLYTSNGVFQIDLTPSTDVKLEHGTTFQKVIANPNEFGENVKRIELKWEYNLNVLEPRTICLLWCNDHLYVQSISVDELKFQRKRKRALALSHKLCPSGENIYADVASRGSATFAKSCKKARKY